MEVQGLSSSETAHESILDGGEAPPTHVIVSAVLRYSSTFALYRYAFNRLGIRHSYVPQELPLLAGEPDMEGLKNLVQVMRQSSALQSIVVSDPYKQLIIPLLDRLTPTAEACRAVNLITRMGSELVGDNFDGRAFRLGVEKSYGVSFRRHSLALFGCGGVSSAVALELCQDLSRIGLIEVAPDRAEQLAERLRRVNPRLKVEVLDRSAELDLRRFTLFYNGTGLGKYGPNENASLLMPLHLFDQLPEEGIAFDANYTPAETAFLSRFASLGFPTVNGFSHMLAFVSLHLSQLLHREVSFELVREWAADLDGTQATAVQIARL